MELELPYPPCSSSYRTAEGTQEAQRRVMYRRKVRDFIIIATKTTGSQNRAFQKIQKVQDSEVLKRLHNLLE